MLNVFRMTSAKSKKSRPVIKERLIIKQLSVICSRPVAPAYFIRRQPMSRAASAAMAGKA